MKRIIFAIVSLLALNTEAAQADIIFAPSPYLRYDASFGVLVDPWQDSVIFPSPKNLSVPLSPWVQQISLPPVPGTLNSVSFGALTIVNGTYSALYDASPQFISDGVFDPWHVRGGYRVSGRISLVSNGTRVLFSDFSFNLEGDCRRMEAGSCVFHNPVESAPGVLNEQSWLALFAPTECGITNCEQKLTEVPVVYAVLENMKFEGEQSTRSGEVRSAVIQGNLTFATLPFIFYDYTPASVVPLPGALWLLVSSLFGLGLVTRKSTKRD